jgi:hypothetical protein
MGFGDFLRNAWGATEKEAKEGMAEASHAITAAANYVESAANTAEKLAGNAIAAAEQDAADAARSAEQEANKIAADVKNDAQKVAASAQQEGKKLGAAVKNDADKIAAIAKEDAEHAVAATKDVAVKAVKTLVKDPVVAAAKAVNDYLERHQVVEKAEQIRHALAATAASIYSKTMQFTQDAIASVEAQCPFAGASKVLSALTKNQELLAKAQNMGLKNDPSVQALQNTTDVMAMALMSDDVYSDKPKIDIPGYHRLSDDEIDSLLGGKGISKTFNTPSPNFHAALYLHYDSVGNAVYTLAFKGTDPLNRADRATDIEQARGLDTPAYDSAIALAQEVKMATLGKGASMQVTGHSLGGGLAQAASSVTRASGAIFNAAGLNQYYLDQGKYSAELNQNLVNYHVVGEIVTTAQQLVPGIHAASATQVAIPAPLLVTAATGLLAVPLGIAPAALAGSVALHLMGSVETGIVNAGAGNQSAVSKLVGGG